MRQPLPAALARVLVLVAFVWGGVAGAQSCLYESEPNDAPTVANELGGETCLTGELAGNDQDAFVWEVSESDALRSWRLEVEGIPGHLTKVDILEVEFSPDGAGVLSYDILYTGGTSNGALNATEPFVVSPGRYLVGVSKSGGEGRYVAHLRTEAELGSGRRAFRGDEQEGEHGLYGTTEGDVTWPWLVAGSDADRRWEIRARGPIDRTLGLELRGPDGETVVAGSTDGSGVLVLAGLGLSEGRHEIVVEGGGDGTPFAVDVRARGLVTDGDEVEPNDDPSSANLITLDRPLTGSGSGSDRDHFLLEVGAADAGDAYDLHVTANGRVDVYLHDPEGRELQHRRGEGGVLRGLVFAEGLYGVTVTSRNVDYTLAFEPARAPRDGFEREPNDALAGATPLGEALTARGELHTQDVDTFVFEVDGEPQRWRIQAIGEGLEAIRTYDGGGARQANVDGSGRLRLDNLVLVPGRHYVQLDGEGEYALRAIALGPPPEPPAPAAGADGDDPAPLKAAAAPAADPAVSDGGADPADEATLAAAADPGPPPPPGLLETEPNDDATRAGRLDAGLARVGILSNGADRDHYRFTLANDGYVRIEAVPAGDGTLAFDTTRANRAESQEPGGAAVLQRWLIAGDYDVRMWAPEPSDGFYQMRLTYLDPLALPADFEPNDDVSQAGPLPRDLEVAGRVGEMRDADVYALPVFDLDTGVRIEVGSGDVDLSLLAEDTRLHRDDDDGAYTGTLPAGEATHLRVRGSGAYRLAFAFDETPDPSTLAPVAGAGALRLELEPSHLPISAYWHQAQAVSGTLLVHHAGDEAAVVALEWATSDFAFGVELPETVEVSAGDVARVPFVVRVPADVRDDGPVRIGFAARDAGGVATTRLLLTPRCEATPVDPQLYWSVPDELLGHLNVAWAPLGTTVVEPEGSNDVYVNDGYTSPGRGSFRETGEALTLDLPGDEPFLLSGTLLHPQSRNVDRQLRAFEVSTSLDGASFTPVLSAELAAPRVEQAFAFDEPVRARYVRLRFLSDHAGDRGAWLGEWKVLAQDPGPLQGLDLADPRLGGFQVWSDPLLPSNSVLAGDPHHASLDGRGLRESMWVLGFHHGRAAQVAHLEWVESERSTPEGHFAEVTVEASLAGPVGPWEAVAEWTLERDGDGAATLVFDEPVWARYLRFTAAGHDPEARYVYPPEEVRVVERPAGDGYRSILGAWGHYRPVGPYEASLPVQPERSPRQERDGGDDRDAATPVASGDTVVGSVAVAEDEDWYRVTVPAGENLLELRLTGDPRIGYHHVLTDAAGEAVVHDVEEEGAVRVLRAFVEPGDYFLHLAEPKRSIVFSWDTSGSMGPYQDITYASVTRFAGDVDPNREYVQLLAFDDPQPLWLLPFWSGDPERVMRGVNGFDRRLAASSRAESAMYEAVRGLSQREGTRAVLFITDHESGDYGVTAELWRAIETTRPRLFTFEVSSGGSGITQDRMQAYAAANGGHYDYARNVGDFDAGFARASCHLRRAKRYELQVLTRYREPPGPGLLTVARAEGADRPAVEVVFDASGSMGAPLPGGEPRIDVAKRVLADLVGEILPDGTPFALRAFGHIAPSSCETRLDLPLAPLDRDAARAAIAGIEPKLLSQTPLAAALEQVPGDLGSGDAARVVILITDGEESCDGDPEAVLSDLRQQGYEVQLSIVSLALSEGEARDRFAALAETAGGTYADVTDADALRASVEAALYPPFEVLDPAGEVVARGRVGTDQVELPMGLYAVRVPGHPLVRDVRVPGDGRVAVTVGGE